MLEAVKKTLELEKKKLIFNKETKQQCASASATSTDSEVLLGKKNRKKLSIRSRRF